MTAPELVIARGPEYIRLETEPESPRVPHPRAPRKKHARIDVRDFLRRRTLRLEIIEYFYLVVRLQRARTVLAEYVLDLRFVDPEVKVTRHIAARWLAATLFLATLAVAIGLRIDSSAAPDNLLAACFIVSGLAVASAVICIYRTTDTVSVRSLHGHARLFEYTSSVGAIRLLRPFLAKLSAHIRIAIAARRPSKALHLRDEMREHFRLHEAGVLSTEEYETGKARILAEHGAAH
jgi:hypothetical protein